MARPLHRSGVPGLSGRAAPQPYGIQQQFRHRIPWQGDRGQIGIVVDNPESFYTLVLGSYPGSFDDQLPPTRGGAELGFVRALDRDTFAYAESIQAAAEAGTTTVEYPSNNIGRQMEVIGRLVSGNLGTPLYLGAQGGFDTHADQPSQHAEVLSRVARAVAALIQDLTNQGLDDRVIVMTVSEFGRRPEENGGYGTDHGTAAPCFVAGTPVNGGVYGEMPSLDDFDQNQNFLVGQDYRGLYSRILGDFFGAPEEVVDDVLQGHFEGPAFLQPSGGGLRRLLTTTPYLHAPSPNPVSSSRSGRVFVRYDLAQQSRVAVDVFDTSGRRVRSLAEGAQSQGRHQVEWDLGRLPAGPYLVRMRTPDWAQSQKVVVLP
ncbi:MAG: DUF1501 domain-containing protein [Candidatus Eisenbacteria bacterium]